MAERRQTALITGASGGIGLELARVFARHGYNLVLVARRAVELGQIQRDLEQRGITVRVIVTDLTAPRAPFEVCDELKASGVVVDVLVNNAGYATYGKFHELDLDHELNMIQLNVMALTALTGLLLPGMVQRGSGRILNIASTAAFQPGPLMAVYYATKAFVLSFSEAIANELRGTGVRVTALCPGPTRTVFQARAHMQQSRLLAGRRIMDARTVARAGYAGMMQGKTVVIPGPGNWLLVQAVRATPRGLTTRIVRFAQERVSRHADGA